MTKLCTKCKVEKDLSCFSSDKGQMSGLRPSCKECKTQYDIFRYNQKREKIKAQTKLYAQNNRAYANSAKRNWSKNNKARVAFWAMNRRARQLNATPKWLTEDHKKQIENFYHISRAITAETGIPHEVDHIVPLQGKIVCGLHVPWNLQVITEKENNLKRHTFEELKIA